ncbi:hypothetical protein C8J57DRAFT_1322925 [Mycena rebaudengoi]|nr:hypothetical protein C8J57DRAFT_1322925 [Mycena rebaudengoi]
MHRSTALGFVFCFASLVAAAPAAPISSMSSSSVTPTSEVTAQPSTGPLNIVAPLLAAAIIPVADWQSEPSSHSLEFAHSAEKSRRRSFRRRHP